ncbi:MAG: hypothetical protein KME40_30155 [Komarekiella atlantica HA4396-MV6]|jgi:hypothetical protein|nr:hypothetical protein [Komarekiella atlantica HA4396-MV6]
MQGYLSIKRENKYPHGRIYNLEEDDIMITSNYEEDSEYYTISVANYTPLPVKVTVHESRLITTKLGDSIQGKTVILPAYTTSKDAVSLLLNSPIHVKFHIRIEKGFLGFTKYRTANLEYQESAENEISFPQAPFNSNEWRIAWVNS